MLRLDIKRVIANPVDIAQLHGRVLQPGALGQGRDRRRTRAPAARSPTSSSWWSCGRSGKLDANDQHIVHIVDWLLQYAFEQRASDIHIEPRRDVGNVRFRIDGVLHQVYQIPHAGDGRDDQPHQDPRPHGRGREAPAAGRPHQDRDRRTATRSNCACRRMPTAFGEKLVMRIFDPDVLRARTSANWASPTTTRDAGTQMIGQPHGIILVTGPDRLRQDHDPVLDAEAARRRRRSTSAPSKTRSRWSSRPSTRCRCSHGIDLDFAAGIRTLMRQDPDIIMVGEIRDLETAEMAIQAALTGHLVLSTLHTNDAPSAITRLLDLGVPSYLLQSTILGVMAQRLVRTLCPHCSEPGALRTRREMLRAVEGGQARHDYFAKGCLECRMTGYMGRVGIYEMMLMTPALRRIPPRPISQSCATSPTRTA